MFRNLFNFKSREEATSETWIFGTLLAFGLTGLGASFTLSAEEFFLLKHPDAVLSCSFNLVLNCATVMKTWQASVFGFPNMFVGLIGFSIVITLALLGLSQVKFPRWFLVGAHVGITLGTFFAYWLFFNSVYFIQVLCPWCLVVTFSMTMLFATITRYNLLNNTFRVKRDVRKKIESFLEKDYDKIIVAAWVVLMIALVITKFGSALFA